MKIRLTSAEIERINVIVEMAAALVEKGDVRKYSQSIEFALTELVRDEMRLLAQGDSPPWGANELLNSAIDQVTDKVNLALERRHLEFNLNRYATIVRAKLKFPAREIQKLSVHLTESRRTEKLGTKEQLVADSGDRLTVHELGLRDAIHGLLVESKGDRRELDVDKLREQPGWRVEGEWFPYELFADDFIFVIDDNGSIFVSTANLPLEVRHQADGLLRRIAELLYSD